ncbi:NPC intracellular cholesterol transporter 1-like [Cherax quadricarinatus]|uniref:NPC intracellular cholesterol transporter 1-like n=1 Tax=Cherax quadricarinatus TaxID=27406 RepID=UPI00387EC3B7
MIEDTVKMEEAVEKVPEQPQKSCIQRLSHAVVETLERSFYRYGESVASHPCLYIAGCLLFTCVACMGFFNFHQEHRPERLWIPQNSDYIRTLDWQAENFPQDQRMEFIMYQADNVLTADYVREMYRIHQLVSSLVVTDAHGNNYTQKDLCFRVPALGGEQRAELRRIKQQIFPYRDPDEDLDWSLAFHKSMYYQFYTKMPTACLEVGILEVWGYDTAVIQALTDDDVLNDINTVNISATFSYPMNFTDFLGGIVKNASGYITGARTALTMLVMQTTRSRGSSMPANSAGLSEEVDMELFAWEGKYIQFLNNNTNRPQGLQVFFQSQRSFGEISGDTILGDVTFLILGNVTLFVYVQLMLGKFNMVENRPLLSLLGLLSTFMAVGVSFGLCSAMGLLYGPVHTILPLLMLGLGVDDMFVIVQCWHNLTPQTTAGDTVTCYRCQGSAHFS